MDAQAVIDSYINSVAAKLPRRVRNDVGLELRTLLIEELNAAAAAEGRAADDKLATEVVRSFGQPEDVASHYHKRGFQIIEPEHAPTFVGLSAAFIALQWAVTLPAVFVSNMPLGKWWLTYGFNAFTWVTVLLAWFGLATWVRRRWPVDSQSPLRPWMRLIFRLPVAAGNWRPIDRDAIERRGAVNAFPIGVALTIFFIAPVWFLNLLTPTGTSTSWALYDADFQRLLLPVLIPLAIVRLGLFAATGISKAWRVRLETVRFVLWIGFVALLYWALFRWAIFATPVVNVIFKVWLLVFLIVNTIQIGVWVRRALTRVRVPESFA
jgi:hypothetical protein